MSAAAEDADTVEKESLMHQAENSMRNIKGKLGSWISSATGVAVNVPTNSEDPQEALDNDSLVSELNGMMELTWHQRMSGFAMALGMGVVFICIAMFVFLPTIALFPQKFAFFYSIGSLFCVCSTVFLVGPKKQVQMMFSEHRAEIAALYFLFLLLTLFSAVHLKNSFLSFTCASLQIAAVFWYSLSYIPYARQFISYAWSYIWVILKPILSAAATCCTSCLRMICSSATS